ncbi:zinc-binding dehydrogenase [Hamadaea sp. NPDC050747]|uniref:alcohol dehydrogenase catalytic domain-containing protein n=1 Tax=Hamadaea sp. NPDC050747 TaxID=3155789 RepID=UPI00340106E4
MRALQQTSLHGPADLRLVDIARPTPGPGEILVRVSAAGINFADVMQTYGTYVDGPTAPYVAGFEAAGEVVALGPGVTAFAVGEQVLGLGPGAFAEYLVLPAAAAMPLPRGWSGEQSLGLMLNWATALAALRLGRVATGETVLVQAAAGGVGQAAVRLARHFGATVLATASPAKHQLVRTAGAHEVFATVPDRRIDVILESVGGPDFARSLAAARPITGRVIVYGVAGGDATVTNRALNFRPVQLIGLHLGVLMAEAPDLFAELLDELTALIAAGVIPPGTPTMYALADGPAALAALASRSTVGKLALRP